MEFNTPLVDGNVLIGYRSDGFDCVMHCPLDSVGFHLLGVLEGELRPVSFELMDHSGTVIELPNLCLRVAREISERLTFSRVCERLFQIADPAEQFQAFSAICRRAVK